MSRAPSASREDELRDLWASSYDGWVNVPRLDEEEEDALICVDADDAAPTTYFEPLALDVDDECLARRPRAPAIARRATTFAVTGHNPMGERASAEANAAANVALERDIRALDGVRAYWRSFGFSKEWREDGFVCAFEDGVDGRATMVALAVKYAQGAIYAYEKCDRSERALRRRTIPAAMSDAVDADVLIAVCEKPGFDF
jgi:hypothetical protein